VKAFALMMVIGWDTTPGVNNEDIPFVIIETTAVEPRLGRRRTRTLLCAGTSPANPAPNFQPPSHAMSQGAS
jgi:hypothetical protein